MSEGDVNEIDTAPAATIEQPAAPSGPLTVEEAIQIVLKKSAAHDGLSRGINECVKALDRQAGQLCILAEDCEHADYLKLVEALCLEHGVKLIKVPDSEQLGKWSGLAKLARDGELRKIVKCRCVVVRDFGEETEAMNVLNGILAQQED